MAARKNTRGAFNARRRQARADLRANPFARRAILGNRSAGGLDR